MTIITVVAITDTGINAYSFTKDNYGRAQELFREIAFDNNMEAGYIESALEEGYIEMGNFMLYFLWGTLDENI